MSTEVEIAVLKTNYDHLSTKVDEVRDEMRSGMGTLGTKFDGMNGKFDIMLTGLRERDAASKLRGRFLLGLAHLSTSGVTLAAIKFLHIPLSLG
jgi:hypothetical protein